MANAITDKDIILINETYLKVGTYAGTARETGFSVYMVKKQVVPNYIPEAEREPVEKFSLDSLPEFNVDIFLGVEDFGELCTHTKVEEEEVRELWKEISF